MTASWTNLVSKTDEIRNGGAASLLSLSLMHVIAEDCIRHNGNFVV